jgi:hypothetical protein
VGEALHVAGVVCGVAAAAFVGLIVCFAAWLAWAGVSWRLAKFRRKLRHRLGLRLWLARTAPRRYLRGGRPRKPGRVPCERPGQCLTGEEANALAQIAVSLRYAAYDRRSR